MSGRARPSSMSPVLGSSRATARSPNMPPRSGTPSPARYLKEDWPMTISPLAGKPAPKEMLVDVSRLEREYFERRPDLDDPNQLVSFGTSGHRGSPLRGSFSEAHILAITQ